MAATLTHLALHVRDLRACVRFYQTYCTMRIVHDRAGAGGQVIWLASPGLERRFILVLLPDGPGHVQQARDYSHLGFALNSRDEVDRLAARALADGCLLWEPQEEPYPVGYYCGVQDPDGNCVEFSYGQPLGPGAPQ